MAARREAKVKEASAKPFGQFAIELFDSIESGFKNLKHRWQWRQTLTAHCQPIWDKPINLVDTTDVLSCLVPLWETRSETASRLRGRIERVLDAAKARGLRSGENPAAWRGNLKVLLPKRRRLTRGHHPALPYVEMPLFMTDLRSRCAIAAFALEFCILTASRTGETLGAEWKEIDLEAGLWVIPAARMKVGKEHRIPLSNRALDILANSDRGQNGRIRVSWASAGKAAVEHGNDDAIAQDGAWRLDGTRLPFGLPRLGGKRDALRARGRRSSARPRHR